MMPPLRSRSRTHEGGVSWAAPLAAILVLVAAHGTAQTPPSQPEPTNLDFRTGEAGSAPPGWLTPPPSSGFVARLAASGPAPDSRSVVIRYEGKDTPQGMGNLRQRIVATPYRSRIVRFKAAARVDPAPGVEARLFVRVERTGGQQGFFDEGVAITGDAWATHAIEARVDPDAATLIVGFRLYGGGAAAIATASLEVAGAAEPAPIGARARPLSERQLENLTAFTRLFGYVRHFHPSDQAAKADWTSLAVEGIPVAEAARDAGELARALEGFFRPVAPTLHVVQVSRPAPHAAVQPPAGAVKQISWKHNSYYGGERVVTDVPPGGSLPEAFAADLGGGVRAVLPLSLVRDADGTLPRAPMPAYPWRTYDAESRAVRLAGVVIAWNVLQHFYSYFDVVKTDWSQVLPASLRAAAAGPGVGQYRETLLRMVAALHDGHGRVLPQMRGARLPIAVHWVGGDLIVTNAEGAAGPLLAPGDAIVAINGRPVAEWKRDKEALLSAATPQYFDVVCLGDLLAGPAGERLALSVEPFNARGTRREVTLERAAKLGPIAAERRPEPVAELRPGVAYVDLTRVKSQQEWEAALPKLEAAGAVVFDMRGYPSGIEPAFLQNLIDKPFTSAEWCIPIIAKPDGRDWTFRTSHWDMKPLAHYVGARKIFLTDGRAISYAESLMGIIEHYRVGDIVGGPTAGTNGNVITTELPGGYSFTWTGMRVLKHDGSRHHGVGILPTVPAAPTREGIAAGRDEVLERALALLDSPPVQKK